MQKWRRWAVVASNLIQYALICTVCQEPVELETSMADDHGKAIHEKCYLGIVSKSRPHPKKTNFPLDFASASG